ASVQRLFAGSSSLPETSPTLRWTGKVGDASAFRVWGSWAFVCDLSADKLSPRAVPCVFLGFPPDAPGWQFYHPTLRRVLSSQDVTFDESVPYYRLFPYRTAPLPPPPLFLAPGPPPVDPLPPQGPAPSGVSQVDAVEPVEVAVDFGATRGAEPMGAGSGGAESGRAEPGGAEPGGAESGGAEPGGVEPGGAESARVASRSASSRRELLSPQELREWFAQRWSHAAGAGGPPVAPGPGGARTGGTGAVGTRGAAAAAGVGPAGASGAAGTGAAGGVGAGVGPVGRTAGSAGGTGAAGPAGVGAVGAGGAAGTGAATGGTGAVPVGTGGPARPRPYFVPLLEQVLGLPPSPGPAPPLECPQPVQSQSPLQPVSPLPAPSPYAGPTGGLAERRFPTFIATPSVLTFDAEGRAVDFEVWVDDLQLFLQCDRAEGLSLFDLTSGASPALPATADSTVRSQWATHDAAARLAVRRHLPTTERAHFSHYRSAQTLYDAVVARYSSPATAALSRLFLPYLFPDLTAFPTVTELITHLRTSDTRYRAALPAEFCAKNPPPMYPTLYYIVTRLPDSLRSVRDHFLSVCPTSLTVDLLEERLLAAEQSIVAVGASRGDPRTPVFQECSPPPLLPSVASAALTDLGGFKSVGAASTPSGRRRPGKGKGGRGAGGAGGGGGGGGGGGSGGGGGGGGRGGRGGGVGSSSGGGGGGGGGSSGSAGRGSTQRSGSDGGPRKEQQRSRETPSSQQLRDWYAGRQRGGGAGPCTYVLRTGDRAGEQCGSLHSTQRCFGRLTDSWRHQFPGATEIPRWGDLSRAGVAIFDLDYDAILAAMYALSTSDEGDCYLCLPPDPGGGAAALGACEAAALGASATAAPGAGESALSGTASAQVFHTFTLDSGASRSFFRDRTTLTPLSRPVAVSLADPSGGPVLASFSTVLPCPAAPSGTLSDLYLPSFSTNLVSGADLQDQGVDQFTPASQRVTHCTCARTGRHLATFTRRPGSSLYTLSIESPPIPPSGQVAASSQVLATTSGPGPESAPCSCRLMSHQTLLWHNRLGHPSLPRLRGLASRVLVSGLPRSLPPLPSGPTPTCLPCVEGQQRAAPHSSAFPPTEAPLQTLHMDVWGPARVRGQGHERYFLLVVEDYSRYTTVFPLRSKGDVTETFTLPASPQQNGIAERRIGMVMDVARTSMIHAAAPHFMWPFAVQYAAHQLNLQPRVSVPETSPTLRWTGKVGDASLFRVWGSRAFVRDLSADKLSPRAVPCVFLGFPPDAPGWQFYHPTSRRVLSSQDVTFYEVLPPSGVSQVDAVEPVEVAVDSGAGSGGAEPGGAGSGGVAPEGAESGSAEPGGAESGGAEPGVAESEGAEPGGAEPGSAEPGGAEPGGAGSARVASRSASSRRELLSPQELREWFARRWSRAAGAGGTPGAAGTGGAAAAAGFGPAGASGAAGGGAASGVGAGVCPAGGTAGATGGTGAAGLAGVVSTGASGAPGAGAAEGVSVGGSPDAGSSAGAGVGAVGAGGAAGTSAAAGGTGAVPAGSGDPARPRPYFVPLLEQVLGLLPSSGPAPSLECPQPVQSQSLLQPFFTRSLRFIRRYFLARELQQRGQLRLAYVASEANTADIFTKALPPGFPTCTQLISSSIIPVSSHASRPASPVRTTRTSRRAPRPRPPELPSIHQMTLRPSTAPLRVPLPSPPASSLPVLADPASDSLRAASPTVARLLSTVVTDPSFESTAASALSASVCPPSVGGECALSTDVLEDRQEEFQCFVAALPHLVSMLIAPEGDPDAPDIPTPRSYAEAIEGPYSSQWQSAMDAEMASWKSTGTYVDAVPPPGANIVSGMWIFRVKRPPGSPPVFKARYVARGFSHADASWAEDQATQRSSQGYTFSLGSGSVLWRSTRSSSVLGSSCEAEIHAGAMAAQEFRWLTYLLTDLGEPPRSPPVLYVDNKAMLALCREHRLQDRTKHIALRYFLARELQQRGQLHLSYVASEANTADIFTKALPPGDHQRFCTMLGPSALRLLVLLATAHSSVYQPLALSSTFGGVRRAECTSGMGLVLGGWARVVLTGHADASWVDDLATQRSS
ncbi:unnamed protein product, partial [Closterium sp. NIES-54]